MSAKSDGQVVIEIVAEDKNAEEVLQSFQKSAEKTGEAAQQAAEQIDEVGESLEKTASASKSASEGVEKVGKQAKKSESEVEGLGNASDEMQKKMAAASATCAALCAGLVAIGVQTVQASMEFESSFAKTQTIMDSNVMSAKQMRQEIMALSSMSGMSGANVSEAVYQAISGSVATEDATAFVEKANKLAVSGFTSLSNATDVLTTALNAYGLEAETVGGISNVLIQTQNLGKTSVDELAASMGRAISTGSAYGVNLENLSTAYVELTRGGIDTAEATTYLSSMLNELGDGGSKVGGILQDQTGKSFGQLMAQGASLGDVLKILSETVDGDAEALMGLWSSQEAGKASNAIMTQGIEDFNAVLSQMNREMSGATGTTDKAYETMTHTSEFIDQKFRNSVNNLGIAFGDNLSPAVDWVKSSLTVVTETLTGWVQEYPAISAAAASLTVGIGALGLALGAYTLKAKLAESQTKKLTMAMMKNPFVLVATGLTAAVVGIGTYIAKTSEATEETEKLCASSEAQRRELEELQAEYEAVCDAQGETSAEAQLLKEKLDKQTEAFEKNKKTAQELAEELKNTHDAYLEMTKRYDDTVAGIEAEYESTLNLIARLNELTEAEQQSASAKQEILTIVDLLNERIPELGLNYDTLTGKLNMTPEDVIQAATAANNKAKTEADYEELKKQVALRDSGVLEATYNAEKAERDALTEEYNALVEKFHKETGYVIDPETLEITNPRPGAMGYLATNTVVEISDQIRAKKPDRDAAITDFDAAEDAYFGNQSAIENLSQSLATYQEETENAALGMEEMGAVSAGLVESLEALQVAYEEAYQAAYESISGQYALWDEVADVAAMSVKDVTGAMQSQTEYWANYDKNLQTLLLYAPQIEGLSDMIAANADGSADSVNLIAGMAESLNDGDIKELEGMVTAWKNLQEQQNKTADSIAELGTGIDEKTKGIIQQFKDDVKELDLSEEAKANGMATIEAYIEGAEALLPDVASAFGSVGEAARRALFGAYGAVGSGSPYVQHAYASGTYSADSGLALVGEAGPELVYLRGGERILTAEETRDVLNTVFPSAPQMAFIGAGAPAIAGRGAVQLHATIDVPLYVDGREFACATAEYMGEEMEFGGM